MRLLHLLVGLCADGGYAGAVGTGALGCGLCCVQFKQLESVLLALIREALNNPIRQLLLAERSGARDGVQARLDADPDVGSGAVVANNRLAAGQLQTAFRADLGGAQRTAPIRG